jgi:hypothetical protein
MSNFKNYINVDWTWWSTSVISAFGRQKMDQEFKDRSGSIARLVIQKKKKTQKIIVTLKILVVIIVVFTMGGVAMC